MLESQPLVGNEPVKITIKYVGSCEPGDYQYLQVFSLILRECLTFLRLQLIRRNYYDPRAKVVHFNFWVVN